MVGSASAVMISTSAVPRAILILALLVGFPACQRRVDMTAHDPKWIATTIAYSGVRDANRQFPDYSSIDARILEAPKKGSGGSLNPGKKGSIR